MPSDIQVGSGLLTKRDFGTIHPKHPWTRARCTPARNYFRSRQETKLHQPSGNVFREVKAVKDAALSRWQLGQRMGSHFHLGSAGGYSHQGYTTYLV